MLIFFIIPFCRLFNHLLPVVVCHVHNYYSCCGRYITTVYVSSSQHQPSSDEGPLVERMCVAGLKVRFSFSPRGTVLGSHGGQNDMLEWFLTSLGATLTEVRCQVVANRI